MAALTVTGIEEFKLTDELVIVKFSVTSGSSASTSTEWVATNLKRIVAVLGYAITGTDPGAGAAVRATATVTFGSTDITDADTLTVNGRVYLFNTTPSGLNSIDIDATEATQAQEFVDAINRGIVSGATSFTQDTAINPDVIATRSNAIVTLHAREPGVGLATANALSGNSMTLATIADSNQISLSGSTFSGGLDAVALSFVLNAQGTGVSADANPGDLGVESSAISTAFDVTVIGVKA